MRKGWLKSIAVLTFAIGVITVFIFTSPVLPPNDNLQLVGFLLPAREWHRMLELDSQPFPSTDFMAVHESISPSTSEPNFESMSAPDLIEHHCATLNIYIDS